MDSKIILSQIPIEEWKQLMREVIREEMRAAPAAVAVGNPISIKELCGILDLTPATIIRYRQKGKIPYLQIGGSIRYELPKVLDALEKARSPKK
jgi:Helix-turn-helix domain